VTGASKPNARWTKDKAGATLAATTGFFFTNPIALETTNQLIPEYAHRAAMLVSIAVAILTYRVELRAMRKLP
jgi:threonine/homoserine efflux transporter RhtA